MLITSKSHRPYSLLAVLLALCLIIGSTGSFSSQTSLAIVSTTILFLIASYYLRPFSNRLSIRQIRTITYLALTLMVVGQVLILICQPCWPSWLFSDFYGAGQKLALPGPKLKSAWDSLPQHCWAC